MADEWARAKGQAEALVEGLWDLCDVLNIKVTAMKKKAIATMSTADLKTLIQHIKKEAKSSLRPEPQASYRAP